MSERNDGTLNGPRYPGISAATDGTGAVVHAETLGSEAAGAYPITPSTQMGEGWAEAVAAGKTNVFGRRLLFFEPEGEHAAAGVTAGMSMTGLRSTNFSSGQGIAYMHESLYAAAGKRLTYVLNVAARAMTKHALNVHAGHDDYHGVDDSGFFQLFGKDVQEIGDFTLIAHRIAELSLTPGLSAQDGFLTSHVIESVKLPEPDLIREYLGDPSDIIESPTPAQRLVFGETRRRIPELFDLDYPALLGSVQNQDAYAQGVAAQRPFYFDHVRELADQAFEEYAELTGRRYGRVQTYRMDDAEYVLVGQGSVVPNAEAVADHLRDERGLRVGVLNVSMFRPFPSDLVTEHLKGRRGVTVLERCDQPLSVDGPLLREIRSAMGHGVENFRARGNGKKRRFGRSSDNGDRPLPYDRVTPLHPDEVPDFYSAGFGFGSRDLQPGDLVAAADNMLPDGKQRRHYYLGIEFIRKGTRLPKLQIWQDKLLEAYPDIEEGAIQSAGSINLLPDDNVSLRIHSVGGWGAITTGKNLGMTAFELFGMNVKANPKYGSEKKGQPTTFYATFSRQPLKLNAELKHVNVVLSPDGNVFLHSNPLAGMEEGGVFVIQSDEEPEDAWRSFPEEARRAIREKDIRVFALDGFEIASSEASDPELRYRMQGAAFMGAFFRAAPLLEREGMSEEDLFRGLYDQLDRKFGSKGKQVVEDNFRVIRRGFDEVREVPTGADVVADASVEAPGGRMPTIMASDARHGIADPGHFFDQVCSVCAVGQEGIADPFAAISAMPAATSAVRDMTDIRFEVPDFIAERCTGCSQCWVQCPDAAIPGLVNTPEDILATAMEHASNGRPMARLNQVKKHLDKEVRKVLDAVEFTTFADTLKTAYGNLVDKLGWDAERRTELDEEFSAVYSVLADFPLAVTTPFYTVPERKEKGSGGLLSITVSPEACKGCNICVDVCPEEALVTVRQDDEIVEQLRENWKFWEELPDTDERYINVRDLDQGIGVLSSLLLKKDHYRSMAGGDGACMGCGEKTAVHLVVSTIEAVMQPRVDAFVEKLDGLIGDLEAQEREIVGSSADLEAAAGSADGRVGVELSEEKRGRLALLEKTRKELEDLRWRYVEGPGGRGRSPMGITNSTGCSSVWGSTYPYNPYPFPWANHLFQDAPSLAIGVFEGHMRKMRDNFVSVRRASRLVDGSYDAEADETLFTAFDWEQFDDEEFNLCPPILSIGGDGAMLDIGFQNLSRLMASGKPIRVLVLDTQVYSNTGGQACTSGFTGQIADMSAWGAAQHGKTEVRKELGYIAMAHRGVFVHQSSQALASHLMEGVIKGLNTRRPAIFNIYTPCPVEHGLADDWAPTAAKMALEARAFPFLTYDPDAGDTLAECLDLDGNPEIEETWPSYDLSYVDDEGEERSMELPLTIADWAATEARFRKHFGRISRDDWSDDQILFHEFVELGKEERDGKVPFIWVLDDEKRLDRLKVSKEMVFLAEERLHFWHQLREMAGLDVPARARGRVKRELEDEFETKLKSLRHDFEMKMAELKATYPQVVARRMAEGLVRRAGDRTVGELLMEAEKTPGLEPISADVLASVPGGDGGPPTGNGSGARGPDGGGEVVAGAPAGEGPAGAATSTGAVTGAEGDPPGAVATAGAGASAADTAVAEAPSEEDEDDELRMEPYIDTALCTSCNDCLNINKQMFAYNENKQAYIADPTAGTYKQLVQAAEKCPADIIHPGDPMDPSEPDLEKWVERAEPFN